GRYVNDVNVVLAITQYLQDVGLDVDLELMEWSSVYTPLLRERSMGPLFFLGTGGGLWSPIYDMTDLAEVDSGTNYTHWADERWFSRWAELSEAATPEETRRIINEMLQVFYDDGPWLHLYFQPDFYGVSNRIAWTARHDERVHLFDAGFRNETE
ncbi:MAG: ABC transporter substrate-binding protein, partial [Gemmatimonadetes bacterium]|nr:ABC transporter substrate-binding protein [Gemmatimonadota bacterium]